MLYGHGHTMWGWRRYTAKHCEYGPRWSALEKVGVEQHNAAVAPGLEQGTASCRGAAAGTKAVATIVVDMHGEGTTKGF